MLLVITILDPNMSMLIMLTSYLHAINMIYYGISWYFHAMVYHGISWYIRNIQGRSPVAIDASVTLDILVGGWATPLKNMSSSIGMIRHSQYFWENIVDVNQTTNQS